MGLSEEERTTKMMWAIYALVKVGRELAASDEHFAATTDVKTIVGLTDKLWHAYLGGTSNSGYWLFGGDLGSAVRAPGGPWSTAIIHQCEENQPEPRETLETLLGGSKRPFDPFEHHLDVEGLLPHTYQKKVFTLYANTEFLSYALRRYPDKFRERFSEVDKIISDLQGACFCIFQGDPAYARAYVGNRVLKAVYKDPAVSEVLRGMHFHHKLARLSKVPLSEVIAWDKEILTIKQTAETAFVMALRIAGRKFHAEHEYTKLVEKTRGMGVRKKVLRSEFDKCVAAYTENKDDGQKRYSDNARAEEVAAIHGYGSYAWFEAEAP